MVNITAAAANKVFNEASLSLVETARNAAVQPRPDNRLVAGVAVHGVP